MGMEVTACSSRMMGEDALAGMFGMVLFVREVRTICTGRGKNFNRSRLKDCVIIYVRCCRFDGHACSCGGPARYRGYSAVVRRA